MLERRNDNWRALHDYILSEREQFELTGPSEQRLYGTRREFTWFVRDGYLVRSPVRFDGVAPDAAGAPGLRGPVAARGAVARDSAQAEKAQDGARQGGTGGARSADAGEPRERETTAPAPSSGQALEPRFISEAYFMRFKFDPGNYYLAGRETLDGRAVLRIEYYPTRLFADDDARERRTRSRASRRATRRSAPSRSSSASSTRSRWSRCGSIPPSTRSSKYTFENTDLNFMPGAVAGSRRRHQRVDGHGPVLRTRVAAATHRRARVA